MTDAARKNIIDTALRLAERLGVPCLLLAVIIWCGREAAISLSQTVLEPIVTSHVEFLDATRETMREIGHTLQEIAVGQNDIKQAVLNKNKTGQN